MTSNLARLLTIFLSSFHCTSCALRCTQAAKKIPPDSFSPCGRTFYASFAIERSLHRSPRSLRYYTLVLVLKSGGQSNGWNSAPIGLLEQAFACTDRRLRAFLMRSATSPCAIICRYLSGAGLALRARPSLDCPFTGPYTSGLSAPDRADFVGPSSRLRRPSAKSPAGQEDRTTSQAFMNSPG